MLRSLLFLTGIALTTLTACASDDTTGTADDGPTLAAPGATEPPTTTAVDDAPSTATQSPPETVTDGQEDSPCDAGEGAEWLDLAGDGTPDAYQLGEGAAAVILLHQNDGRACDWLPFAETLVDDGYAVLVPVMRSGTWPQPVITLGAEHLRGEGAEHLALVGASMGGTYALAAAPELVEPPDLVVAGSAPDFYQGASARDVIADLQAPILLLVAEHDTSFVAEAESLSELAPAAELVTLQGAAHGIRLLDLDPAAAQTVLDTLQEHAPAG